MSRKTFRLSISLKTGGAAKTLQKIADSAARAGRAVSGVTGGTGRGQQSWDRYGKAAGRAARGTRAATGETTKWARAADNADRSGGRLLRRLFALAAGFISLGAVVSQLSAGAAAFSAIETGLIGVEKTTSLSETALDRFNDRLSSMSVGELPLLKTSLLDIGAVSGQVGVRGSKDLETYIQTIGKLEAATDLVGGEAVKKLTRMLTVQGEAPERIERLGSAVVDLGNSAAASESEIVSMSTEVALATASLRLGTTFAVAFGTAMVESGIRSELGGSVIGKTLREIAAAVARGGIELRAFADVAGVSADEFARAWERDPVEALNLFLGGLSEFGKNAPQALASVGLVGDEVNKVLPVLATNFGLVMARQEQAAAAAEKMTALSEEARKAFSSQASDLQRLRNAYSIVSAELGARMSPALRQAAIDGRDLLLTSQDLAGALGELAGRVLTGLSAALLLLAKNLDIVIASAAVLGVIVTAYLAYPLVAAISAWTTALIGMVAAQGLAVTVGGALGSSVLFLVSAYTKLQAVLLANPIIAWTAAVALVATTIAAAVIAVRRLRKEQEEYNERLRFGRAEIEQSTRAHQELIDILDKEIDRRRTLRQEGAAAAEELSQLEPILENMRTALDAGDFEAFEMLRIQVEELGISLAGLGDGTVFEALEAKVSALRAEVEATGAGVAAANANILSSEEELKERVEELLIAETKLRQQQSAAKADAAKAVASAFMKAARAQESLAKEEPGLDPQVLDVYREKLEAVNEQLRFTAERLKKLGEIADEKLTELFQANDFEAAAKLLDSLPDDLLKKLFPGQSRAEVLAFQKAMHEALLKEADALEQVDREAGETLERLKRFERAKEELTEKTAATLDLVAAYERGPDAVRKMTDEQEALAIVLSKGADLSEQMRAELKKMAAEYISAQRQLSGTRALDGLARQLEAQQQVNRAYQDGAQAVADAGLSAAIASRQFDEVANGAEDQAKKIRSFVDQLLRAQAAEEGLARSSAIRVQVSALRDRAEAYRLGGIALERALASMALEQTLLEETAGLTSDRAAEVRELAAAREGADAVLAGQEVIARMQDELTLMQEIEDIRARSGQTRREEAVAIAEVTLAHERNAAMRELSFRHQLALDAVAEQTFATLAEEEAAVAAVNAEFARQAAIIQHLLGVRSNLNLRDQFRLDFSASFDLGSVREGLRVLKAGLEGAGEEVTGFANQTEAVATGAAFAVQGLILLGGELGIFTEEQIRRAERFSSLGAQLGQELGGQIGAAIGSIIGAIAGALDLGRTGNTILQFTAFGAQVAGLFGAVIGAFVGWAVDAMHHTAQTFADGSTQGGRLTAQLIEGSGQLAAQTNQIIKTIVSTVNEILDLIDGAFSEFDVTTFGVQIREDSKGIRVWIDGIRHEFGEDMQRAVDFAVTEIFKRTKVNVDSPVISAALAQFQGETVKELQDALATALEIENLKFDDFGLELHQKLRQLDLLLKAALEEFGAGAENVLIGPRGIAATLQAAYRDAFLIEDDPETVEAQTRANIEAVRAKVEIQKVELLLLKTSIEAHKLEMEARAAELQNRLRGLALEGDAAKFAAEIHNLAALSLANSADFAGRSLLGLAGTTLASGQAFALSAAAAAEALAAIDAALDALNSLDFSPEAIEEAIRRARDAAADVGSVSIPSFGGGVGGGGFAGGTIEEARERMARLRLLASGVAESTLDLLDAFRDFDEWIDSLRQLGVAEEELAEIRASQAQLDREQIVAAHRENLRRRGQSDLLAEAESRANRFGEALQNALAFATREAERLGVEVGDVFGEIRDLILEDFAGEVGDLFLDQIADLVADGDGAGLADLASDWDAFLETLADQPDLLRAIQEAFPDMADQIEAAFEQIRENVLASLSEDLGLDDLSQFQEALAGIRSRVAKAIEALVAAEAGEDQLAEARRQGEAAIARLRREEVQRFEDLALGQGGSDPIDQFRQLQEALEETLANLSEADAPLTEILEVLGLMIAGAKRLREAELERLAGELGVTGGPSTIEARVRAADEALSASLRNLHEMGAGEAELAEARRLHSVAIEELDAQLQDLLDSWRNSGLQANDFIARLDALREAEAQAIADSAALATGVLDLIRRLREVRDAARVARQAIGIDLARALSGFGVQIPGLEEKLIRAEHAMLRAALAAFALEVGVEEFFEIFGMNLAEMFGLLDAALEERLAALGSGSGFRVDLGDVDDDDNLSDLARKFRDIQDNVNAFIAGVDDVGASGLRSELLNFQRSYDEVLDQVMELPQFMRDQLLPGLRDAYERGFRAIVERAKQPARDLLKELEGENAAPGGGFQEALREFRDLGRRAAGGDLEALEQLEGAGRRLLAQSDAYLGQGVGSREVRDEIMRTLRAATGREFTPEDIADPVVGAVDRSNELLEEIRDASQAAAGRTLRLDADRPLRTGLEAYGAAAFARSSNPAYAGASQVGAEILAIGHMMEAARRQSDEEVREMARAVVEEMKRQAKEERKERDRDRSRGANVTRAEFEQRGELLELVRELLIENRRMASELQSLAPRSGGQG